MNYLRMTINAGLCLCSLMTFATVASAQGTLFVRNHKVGIGTDTPAFDLHLINSSASANVWIEGASSGAMEFVDGDAPADEGIAQFLSSNGQFRIRGLSDALVQTVPGIVLDLGTGEVGVGTTGPALQLEVEDTSTTGPVLRLQNADGTCDLDPNTGGLTWSCTSDLRLKADVKAADTAGVLAKLLQMHLFDYRVVASGERRIGFIAQDLRRNDPERVTASDDGTLMAQQPDTTELLAAVQALHQMVSSLQERVTELESELAATQGD